ncbi:MAG: hypothetical protein IT306_01035 [Chloroflexi bacterium]|nr:hypothetical protein [Chloroflexota bacterium]
MSQTIPPVAPERQIDASPEEENSSLVSVISWRGVLVGTVVTVALAWILGAVTAETLETNLGARAALMFIAMFIGAFVAGRIAGRMGAVQGIAMAVIFIVVGASIKAYAEIDLATKYGHQVLGPMDMGGLILGDLIHLIGGFAGGWLADTMIARSARSAAR